MSTTAPNLERSFPRAGREKLGGYAWLGRLADKARAEQAGTEGDYVAYCPISSGFLERAGVSQATFEQLIDQQASDSELKRYFDEHVSAEQRDAANQFVLDDMREHLAEQDAEEGR